ncbi:MAG: hypothetical protein H0V17_08080 [Deltaproteobacteria bacterium]|nr:hypothetical protein [Deltaproteobacteria bacterium]
METGELLAKGVKALDRAMGTGLGGLAGAVLTDPKFPDPVVPPDLHLVKPATVDANGDVQCLYCGRAVKWEAAQLVGSAGFECGTCQHAFNHAEATPLDTRIGPRKWPWIVIGVLAVGGGIGAWQYLAARARAELAKEFPVAASDADQDVIDRNVDRWTDGMDKLAVAVDNPPPLRSLKLGAACDVSIDGAMELRSDKHSPDEIKREIKNLVKSAERGRFKHELSLIGTVRAIQAPVLATTLHEESKAKLHKDNPEEPVFDAGVVAGTAYVFDPDGTLRCAGAFEATSSEKVEYTRSVYGWESDEEKRRFNDSDRWSADLSLDSDLEKQMAKAIAASLKKVD